MKESLYQFLGLWWKGFAKGLHHHVKVEQLHMAASCLWLVGHPDCPETKMDEWIKEWLDDTNPM